jgi:soluble lytic murein transglycosylase-like protein
MKVPLARSVAGMGVSAAVWVGVVLAPTGLSRERPVELPPELPPETGGLPPPRPDAFRHMDDLLAYRDPSLDLEVRGRLAAAIVGESEAAHLDPLLVLAVIEVESSFDTAALSGAGAMGLMQLREPTLRSELRRHGLEGDIHDPVTNVRAGVRYLRRLFDAFPAEDVALMAYNAGPNRILGYLRAGEIPDRFHVYPRRVKAALRRLRREARAPAEQVAALRQAAPASKAPGRIAD